MRHLALVGPTASGKSAVALELARLVPGTELLSVDSMQVYRGMDIGTAKPTAQERSVVAHHLLDLADPTEDFSVARFQAAFRAAMSELEARGARAVLVGGTGLYHRAVIDELGLPGRYPAVRHELEGEPDTVALHRRLATLDPVAAGRMEPTNRRRVLRALEVTVGSGRPFSSFGPGLTTYPPTRFALVGLDPPPEVLGERIAARVHAMFAAGLVEEVRDLLRRYPQGLSRTARQALGYREVLAHLEQGVPLEETVDLVIRRTRQFARRQRAWFRRDPRIRWVATGTNPLAAAAGVLEHWDTACRS